jgi:hypothetical protein
MTDLAVLVLLLVAFAALGGLIWLCEAARS